MNTLFISGASGAEHLFTRPIPSLPLRSVPYLTCPFVCHTKRAEEIVRMHKEIFVCYDFSVSKYELVQTDKSAYI